MDLPAASPDDSARMGWIRAQETCAFWIELKSLAADGDFWDSLEKQDKKVVKAAMSHTWNPVPLTLRTPKYRIRSTLVIEGTR